MQATSFLFSNMTFLLTCSERMFSHLVLTIARQGILTNTYLKIPTLKLTIMEANPNERKHHWHVHFAFFTNSKRKSITCTTHLHPPPSAARWHPTPCFFLLISGIEHHKTSPKKEWREKGKYIFEKSHFVRNIYNLVLHELIYHYISCLETIACLEQLYSK